MEQWRNITGFDGVYQVSDLGRIKSLEKIYIGTSWTGVRCKKVRKERIRKLCLVKGGYLSVFLNGNGIRKSFIVHRLVANAFIPNPQNKPEVNHIDSNPANNHASNLEWVTELENVAHAVNNFYKKNEGKHWRSKISKDDADFIRNNFKKTFTAKELSEKFNLDLSTVYYLLRGETWKQNEEIRIFKRRSKLVES